MRERAFVREVGLRDGLQSLAEIMPTEQKIAWLDAEHAAGVREIEVSSFVPPKLLPQLADAEAMVRHALSLPGLTVSALIPNLKGAERGLALGVHEMNFVLSVSEGHNRANVRRSTEEFVEDFRRVVALCHTAPADSRPRIACGLATAFGCTIEGDVDEDRVRRIAVEVGEAGADAILLADTVGYGNPAAVERVFRRVMADVAPLPVAGHFHDTRGLGTRQCIGGIERRGARVRRLAGRARGLPLCARRHRQHRHRRSRLHARCNGFRDWDRSRPPRRGARTRSRLIAERCPIRGHRQGRLTQEFPCRGAGSVSPMTETLEGGCSCGAVRYRLNSAPMFVHCCHCRDCQRQTGAAFALNALIETDRITLLSGEPRPIGMPTDSGRPHHIYRCPTCQIAVWSEYGGLAKLRFVRVGTLDDSDALPPDVHIYTRSKLPWVVLPSGVPAFEAYYSSKEVWPAASLERRRAILG